MNRRQMAATCLGIVASLPSSGALNAAGPKRKFTMDLCPGRIGVGSDQLRTIELASQYGFESVEPFGNALVKLSDAENASLLEGLAAKNLVWGAAGLSVEFRQEAERFDSDLKLLPNVARALQRAGVSRVGTWLMPNHATLTYRKNFQRHVKRLRQIADVLGDYGLSLGLEYVGPKTLWTKNRFVFVHTMEETKELLSEIGASNVGFVLDSWHWYTAEETKEELLTLQAGDIIAVDLNDAPTGIAVADQIDNRRELPMATGVIDIRSFLSALVEIGYNGPVRAEPFNKPLNDLDDEPAVAATAKALNSAFAVVS
ncbi:MAG: sugar phosphate isomerase/epimerase [Planctomycetales bacterium]|nr:sugar phosphate isomerase/epimerase [Planctomycetales bacterium]